MSYSTRELDAYQAEAERKNRLARERCPRAAALLDQADRAIEALLPMQATPERAKRMRDLLHAQHHAVSALCSGIDLELPDLEEDEPEPRPAIPEPAERGDYEYHTREDRERAEAEYRAEHPPETWKEE